LALTLGGLWPVRHAFAIAGVAIGFLFALGVGTYIGVNVLTSDSLAYEYMGRTRFLLSGLYATFAIFGGWSIVMLIGAAFGGLAKVLTSFRRPVTTPL
jgi:hypothetical protein